VEVPEPAKTPGRAPRSLRLSLWLWKLIQVEPFGDRFARRPPINCAIALLSQNPVSRCPSESAPDRVRLIADMEPFSPEAPLSSAASSSGSPTVSSDSPGTATLSATTDGRASQQPAAPPSVPAACLACVSCFFYAPPAMDLPVDLSANIRQKRGKHLKCDGLTPCSRCTISNSECVYVASRRGYKGPRRNTAHNPHKRHASSSPPYAGAVDSCPMLLGHTPVSIATPTVSTFSPSIVLPEQSPAGYTAPSAMSTMSIYRNPFVPTMEGNALALSTIPQTQPPVASLAERCFDAFYHCFYAAHPFVLPKEFFIRLLKESPSPNLEAVMAAMRYLGSLYVECGPTRASYLDEAIRLCYLPTTAKDGFLIQALLLIIVGLDGSCQQERARELLADCERYAIEIDLNKREFATLHGHGNPVLEESWRRTWWDLYVCDGMIAGVHRVTNFLLFDISSDVALPCEEHQYLTGVCVAIPTASLLSANPPCSVSPRLHTSKTLTTKSSLARTGNSLRLPTA
jgi:hypothetical protein